MGRRAYGLVATFGVLAGVTTAVYAGVIAAAEAPPSGPALVSVVPARLLETRSGPTEQTVDHQFEGIGELAADSTLDLIVAGRGGVPTDAQAVMLNVTAVLPAGPGFLTVFPTGAERPGTSNVNYSGGDVSPNAVLARIGTGGKVSIYTLATSHVIVDVTGYVPADGSFGTIVPARLLETRSGPTEQTVDHQFGGIGERPADSTLDLLVAGRGGVPADVDAVMLNVTAVFPAGPGFLTVFPTGAERPGTSNVNYAGGDVSPNAVLAKVGTDGRVSIYTSAASHVLVDVTGYVPAGVDFGTIDPARMLETRSGPTEQTVDHQFEGIGERAADTTLDLLVAGRGGVPSDAQAVLLNVTAVFPVGPGFLTVFPTGAERPGTSNVNYSGGDVSPNAVLAKIGTDGQISIYTSAASHVLVDVTGYVPGQAEPEPTPTPAPSTTPTPSSSPTPDPTVTPSPSPTVTPSPTSTPTPTPSPSPTPTPSITSCTYDGLSLASSTECDALVAIYNATGGPSWMNQADWLTDSDPCTWQGIVCTATGITELQFQYTGLVGDIPAELGDLVHLEEIVLSSGWGWNQVTSLPPEIGNLANLTSLNLIGNPLTSLPNEFANLTSLSTLWLPSAMTVFPDAVGLLPNLTELNAYNPGFDTLPASIGGLTTLTTLNLAWSLPIGNLDPQLNNGDALSEIAPEIGNLVNLVTLNLYGQDVAVLPDEIGNLASLKTLNVSFNQLGALPATIGDLANLEVLNLTRNQLTDLPDSLTELVALKQLHLGRNQLTSLPTDFGDLTALEHLEVSANNITALPASIGNLANLRRLLLGAQWIGGVQVGGGNPLTALPPEIGGLTALEQFDAFFNRLTTLPIEFGNLTNLTSIDLRANGLTGNITAQFAPLHAADRLTSLQMGFGNGCLTVSDPVLAGWLASFDPQWTSCPPGVVSTCTVDDVVVDTYASQFECDALVALYDATDGPNWTSGAGWNTPTDPCSWYGVGCMSGVGVVYLNLYSFGLAGNLPPELGDLTNLTGLWVGQNHMTALPTEIGNLTNLKELDLWDNQISELPASLALLDGLQTVNLGENGLSSIPVVVTQIAGLRSLDLAYNAIDSLPSSLASLTSLEHLNLNGNQLTALPSSIGNMTNLRALSLWGNPLTEVPELIAGLTNLTYLELGALGLSTLPPWIGDLTNLTALGLSYNQFISVPEVISGLGNLATLSFHNNQLSTLPEWLGDLTLLGDLQLHGNQLTELPIWLGELPNLYLLTLDGNSLSGDITDVFQGLTDSLDFVRLRDNGCLTTTDAELAVWLTGLDPYWQNGCPTIDIATVTVALNRDAGELVAGLRR